MMNSLAFFRLPLKVGHVPKRLVGVGVDAIVGGSGIGLSGGISDPGSGSLDFSVAMRDNPVKGLNTDSETGSLESSSC